MCWLRSSLGLLLCSVFMLAATALLRAEQPASPLRLVPHQADLILHVPQPHKLIDTLITLPAVQELKHFESARELYDSTNAHRGQQLTAHFEKQLGHKWPELTERLAGGGAVLAVTYGVDPAPALLVVQGSDPALLRRFAEVALGVVEQELARQEAKDRLEKGLYRDLPTVRLGAKFHAAVAGSALLIANTELGLQRAIDLYREGDKKSMTGVVGLAEAHRLLPATPLVSLWLNLETVRRGAKAREIFYLPRNETLLTILFGGWLDVARRSPFLCAGLYRQADDLLFTVRLPRGRDGMLPALAVHLPPVGQAGSLPLLEPPGVLYSTSYYLDACQFWEQRNILFNEQQRKKFEEFNKTSGRFLLGHRFSELLAQLGMHQRIVAVHQAPVRVAGREVAVNVPAFALVLDMRQPDAFSRSMNTILRGAALVAGIPADLRLVEEKHGRHLIVGYRFPEDGDLKGDVNNVRFNFTPCFVRVGDQFVISSTLPLAHILVDLVEKEAQGQVGTDSAPSVRTQIYASGAARALQSAEDQLLAQTILNQAMPPIQAREQVRAFIDWVRRLGVVRVQATYTEQSFHYEIRYAPRGGSAGDRPHGQG